MRISHLRHAQSKDERFYCALKAEVLRGPPFTDYATAAQADRNTAQRPPVRASVFELFYC